MRKDAQRLEVCVAGLILRGFRWLERRFPEQMERIDWWFGVVWCALAAAWVLRWLWDHR